MSYGIRYLALSNFISYCEGLKVKTDKDELEYYEKQGLMLPVARVVRPSDCVRDENNYMMRNKDEVDYSKWPELLFLTENSTQEIFTDDELMDSFDRGFENRNPYLHRPSTDSYKPWKIYDIVVKEIGDSKIIKSTAEHYYSYYQVHQLYKIQCYPDLFENKLLLKLIPDEIKERYYLPRALDNSIYLNLEGQAYLFDALSFFIVIYNRIRRRAYANVLPEDGLKILTADGYRKLVVDISKNAQTVAEKYSLTEKHLFEFLNFLLNRKREYEDKEKIKLAQEIENDIHYCVTFIWGLTGKDFKCVAEELGKTYPFWQRESLLNLNQTFKYASNAKLALESCFDIYEKVLSTKQFKKEDIEQIINFCLDKGLLVLLHSLDQSVFTTEELLQKDTEINRYIALKNLSTSFEYLLGIFTNSNQTFKPLIKKVFKNENWLDKFIDITRKEKWVNESNFNNYLENYKKAIAESDIDLQNILLAYHARNVFVHNYPPYMEVFKEIYWELFRAVKYSIIFSWIIAKRDGLI